MEITAISNQADYYRALQRVEELWHAREGSPEKQELRALVALVVAYGCERYQPDSQRRGRKPIKVKLFEELRKSLVARLRPRAELEAPAELSTPALTAGPPQQPAEGKPQPMRRPRLKLKGGSPLVAGSQIGQAVPGRNGLAARRPYKKGTVGGGSLVVRGGLPRMGLSGKVRVPDPDSEPV